MECLGKWQSSKALEFIFRQSVIGDCSDCAAFNAA